ncbi:methionine synthase [Prevotella sp. E15-22]|uniref:methionine synthase n=1 Tax=Prevotella sp. E15-22 TaxID=2937774 RepID=UPI002070B0F0|nr:methionine synthase [Prevotella sp. E15-22]UPS44454.1 methionine synthase [Prevotella sp. E15-22]
MKIEALLKEKILILDGAMGTKIQSFGLTPEHYQRGQFAQWPVSLTGNNDILSLTAPEVIKEIHRLYVEAGADIIATNTFSSNRISQHEYGCEEVAYQMAKEGARIAREVADSCTERPVFVAGSMGPTARSLSLASNMNEPGYRPTSFDEMAAVYHEQAKGLMDGGADVLLVETCFDALNTKAALYAIQQLNEETGSEIPVMVSATINDRSGRTLTGQTLEAFFISVCHYPHLLSFGLNCSFGVTDLRPFVELLAKRIPVYLSLHPNAGLPNEMGEYDELPSYTASHIRQMAEDGLINIAGGCCGTNEEHIHAISEALKGLKPRDISQAKASSLNSKLWLSGLEPLLVDKQTQNFTNVGERTNVAGSRKFARLIAEKKYEEAMTVARHQIEGGAAIIDINMDDAMLNSKEEMQTFCRYIANDPAVCRSVLMIDSSDWDTILAGLKNAQGKCIVNSISLKNGEESFISKARELRRLGAAVVVMAFDEEGQATTFERKIAIAERAYNLLTGIGFPPQDIIFDVNILSVGTGLKEHQNYGVDFIKAVAWIKEHLPGAKTSGGVSNLSFSFRGNNKVREAMHSAFLYHAIRAGLDMGIVNPGMLQVYDDIDPTLLKAVEDVILNTDDGATERLIDMAAAVLASANETTGAATAVVDSWRTKSIEERLLYALSKGVSEHLAEDIPEALQKYGRPIDVIEQPLMQAMEHIGQLFGEGKMFLPQVVKSAKVMKEAVAHLQPFIDAEGGAQKEERPCVVLATANGDVHDIGKNIVSIVLNCNGFEVVDLGVMVPNETILEETRKRQPCLVGVSGLITPSLKEMEQLCMLFQREGLRVPIVVGGATTSTVHTAVKLAPLYEGCVAYGGDASQTSLIAKHLQMDATTTIAQIKAEQQELREAYEEHHAPLTPYAEANAKAPQLASFTSHLSCPSNIVPQTSDLLPLIDWRMFLLFWGFKGETLQQLLVNPEAERTLKDGQDYLAKAIENNSIRLEVLHRFEAAKRQGNDIVLESGKVMPMLRSQSAAGHYLCLADYFDTKEATPIGLFVIACQPKVKPEDEGERLMSHAICARLTEACAEWLQKTIMAQADMPSLLRVGFGYATCPDHSLKRIVFDELDAERQMNVTLNDHYSIQPSTAICGLFITHPEARYFPVGRIDEAQLADYCQRRGISLDEGEQLLSKYIAK